MKRLTQGQKITIIGVAVLLLVIFLFPPWKSRIGSSPVFESPGYKFILAPPEGFDVSIDLWRLLIQSLIIMLTGFIAFCVFAWRTPRDNSKPPAQSLPTPKNVDNLDRPPTISSRFKSQEEYERWKREKLELLSQKGISDLRSISPQATMHSFKKKPTPSKAKSFSWKSLILAFGLAFFIDMFVAIATHAKPSGNIGWTIVWMYLTIEAWRYWRWKAFIPYPALGVASVCIGLLMVRIGVDKMSLSYLIVKVGLNIGGLIIFFLLLRKSKRLSAEFKKRE